MSTGSASKILAAWHKLAADAIKNDTVITAEENIGKLISHLDVRPKGMQREPAR